MELVLSLGALAMEYPLLVLIVGGGISIGILTPIHNRTLRETGEYRKLTVQAYSAGNHALANTHRTTGLAWRNKARLALAAIVIVDLSMAAFALFLAIRAIQRF